MPSSPRRRNSSTFRKILVGFDGSAQGDKALDTALSLAQALDADVLVFAVARPPEPATRVEVDAMLDGAREHFQESFKKIALRAAELGIQVDSDIAVGHPVEQIVHRAEIDQVDLIVLGRRGHSRWARMLVGSTAEKVLRYAHCPVMVVR
jgi:nucleotide-binding universal stress UspA family protein